MQSDTEIGDAAATERPDRRTGTRIARASFLPVSVALASAVVVFAGVLYAPGPDDAALGAGLRVAAVVERGVTLSSVPLADDCPREPGGAHAANGYLVVLEAAPPRAGPLAVTPVPTI